MTRRHRVDLRVLLGNEAVPLPAAVTATMPPPESIRPARGRPPLKRGPNKRTLAVLEGMPAEFTASEWMTASGTCYDSTYVMMCRLVQSGRLTVKPMRRPGSGGAGGVVYVKAAT